MKSIGIKRLAGVLLAAMIVGGPMLAPAVAQTASSAPAASAAPASAAPSSSAPAASSAPASSAPAAAATPPVKLDSGDTAWMLTSTALVLMMTIPGLALFYGGMVRKKNVLDTLAQSFVITCLVTVLWMIVGYSLAFTTNPDAGINKWIGAWSGPASRVLMAGSIGGVSSLANTIPESVFMCFQMTFAIITPALICGSFAERMKFSGMILFMCLWLLCVYCPIAHWVWGGGFLGAGGVLDFAGGTVVHINAGVAGLVTALVLGKRKGLGHENMAPHNLVLTMIGASLLWVGWFGFNAGSAVTSSALAGSAFMNTQVATATAALAWMVVEWIERKKPTLLGLCSGAVAGLVAITPASGFVNPVGSLIVGVAAGVGCYAGAVWVKKIFKYDDALDAFGVHAVGGLIGALLTGALADAAVNSAGAMHSVLTQAKGVVWTIGWTALGTFVILMICKFTTGIRVSEEAEVEGLDLALHGETVHD